MNGQKKRKDRCLNNRGCDQSLTKKNILMNRLLREKRCGTVEILDDHSCRFSAEVFDTNETVPWIRIFICKITDINFSNKEIGSKFRRNLEDMYRLYNLTGG